jgi:hypothetical protein
MVQDSLELAAKRKDDFNTWKKTKQFRLWLLLSDVKFRLCYKFSSFRYHMIGIVDCLKMRNFAGIRFIFDAMSDLKRVHKYFEQGMTIEEVQVKEREFRERRQAKRDMKTSKRYKRRVK